MQFHKSAQLLNKTFRMDQLDSTVLDAAMESVADFTTVLANGI